MQLGWGGRAKYFHESELKYGNAELQGQAVIMLKTDIAAATSSLITFGRNMQTLDFVLGQLQMPQGTS
jgi:hypothetical protein